MMDHWIPTQNKERPSSQQRRLREIWQNLQFPPKGLRRWGASDDIHVDPGFEVKYGIKEPQGKKQIQPRHSVGEWY